MEPGAVQDQGVAHVDRIGSKRIQEAHDRLDQRQQRYNRSEQ